MNEALNIDPAMSLALSVYAHKGVYAVLLGSGISRSAGIPTGWDIIKDLIRQVAVLEGPDPGEDAEKWYRERFKKGPDYSELVEKLAPTPPERMSLLKGYFEPTEQEKEQGLKVPSPAHKAIALLVAAGYIKVIVTTNFDRLMERALEAEGVSPTVVSSPDQIAGMMPLPHVQCLVVKMHGDYLDTRIKNTPGELAAYDGETNALLDRIFAEYGLIVCGWSGDWDPALAAAIERSTRHRFTTYWMVRGKLSERATALVKHRQAVVISIESADRSFADLEVRIAALAAQRLGDPMSPRLAVAMMKRFLAEEKYRIQLEDLVVGELNAVRKQTSLDAFPLGSPKPDQNTYPARVEQMEVICSKLVPMVATGVYWGKPTLDGLWRRCAETLARTELRSGTSYDAWSALKYYPMALVVYSAGICAMVKKRFDLLKLLLQEPVAIEKHEPPEPLASLIGSGRCLHHAAAQLLHPKLENSTYKTPGSDWMVKRLQPMLADIIGEDLDFEALFDQFEIIIALVATDLDYPGPVGRFGWRGDALSRLMEEMKSQGAKHPLLSCGFFNGQVEKFQKAAQAVAEVASRRRWG